MGKGTSALIVCVSNQSGKCRRLCVLAKLEQSFSPLEDSSVSPETSVCLGDKPDLVGALHGNPSNLALMQLISAILHSIPCRKAILDEKTGVYKDIVAPFIQLLLSWQIWPPPVNGGWLIWQNLCIVHWATHSSEKLAAGYAIYCARLACAGCCKIWYYFHYPLCRFRSFGQ